MKTKTKNKFKHLEKWKDTLSSCIRCGYCYEHCPFFKHTGWESEAPRSKIITAFGFLSRELEPTKLAADKLFTCFFCMRCEAACSSGVPLTQIFIDARKDLVELGVIPNGTISTTNKNCARCLICIKECPHDARYYDDKIMTDSVKCKSCGICLEVCPAGATKIENHFGTQKNALIKKAEDFLISHKLSKAIIFACNWSYYPELQASVLPNSETKEKEYEILVNMCGGRLEEQLLMAPLLKTAWGVMAACCPDDQCEHNGNKKAKNIIANIQKKFESIGIDPKRIKLVQIPAGDKKLFQAEIDTFIDTLNQLGPIN